MIESTHEVITRDGSMTTFMVHPDRNGPFPAIIFYMDAPGIREELRDMCRRLATSGYCVVLPNLYYRSGEMELGPLPKVPGSPERARMQQLIDSLSIPMIMQDSDGLLAFLAAQAAVRAGPMACFGHCMSGRFAISAAARYPERIVAAASMYGTRLIAEDSESPHRVAGLARGELYFACAEDDSYVPLAMVERLRAALEESGAAYELEVYPGTHHGFAFPQRVFYDKHAAEQHWERLLSLFRRTLLQPS